jgi:hypothetical protein
MPLRRYFARPSVSTRHHLRPDTNHRSGNQDRRTDEDQQDAGIIVTRCIVRCVLDSVLGLVLRVSKAFILPSQTRMLTHAQRSDKAGKQGLTTSRTA